MSVRDFRLAAAGVALATAMAVAGPAFAIDAEGVAEALVAVMSDGGSTVTYDDATESGGEVTISNLKVVSEDGGTGTVPVFVVTNPQDRSGGGFTADRITFDNAMFSDDESTVTWDEGSADTITVPSAAEVQGEPRFLPFSQLSLGGMAVKNEEGTITIDGVDVQLSNVNENVPHDYKVDVTALKIPPEMMQDDPSGAAALQQLGYTDGFTINMAIDAGYVADADRVDLRNIVIDTVDVGKLTLTGALSGLPLSKLEDPDKAQELLATAQIDKLMIRFDNSGIVGRALDMASGMAGVSSADYAQQLAMIAPGFLTVLENPAFEKKLADAISAFLTDPKSLTITASPASPVAVMAVAAAAQTSPGSIADLLSVDVVANQ